MNSSSSASSSAQEQQAWQWLMHRQTTGSMGYDAAFLDWLAADPAHPAAYARAEKLWAITERPAQRLADEESAVLAGYLARLATPVPTRRRPIRQWTAGLAMAASLLLMLWIGAGGQPENWLENLQADYHTGTGEVRELTLADGSQLTLDAQTALRVQIDGNQRRVELLRGAVWFKVSHNAALPFIVHTEQGETRVLGTEFEVRRLAQETHITLASGRVAVHGLNTNPPVMLQPGQQVKLNAQGQRGDIISVDSRAALAWKQGWLTFYQTPLREVLARLSPYYPGRILLLNEALAERRVSGSFPSTEPLLALNSLQAVLGFQQDILLGRLVILR